MLREEIWPVISIWENSEDLIFMQNGAPPYSAIVVHEWLNAHIPGRWMGCDITTCHFFHWGCLKEQVYFTKPTTLKELEGQIREGMSSIPQVSYEIS